MNDLFEHALQNLSDSEMVGITIQNRVNQNDKLIGIIFRRKDQLAGEVTWSLVEKVSQSYFRFKGLDKLIMNVHSVRMPVGFGKPAMKSKGHPLAVMAQLKTSVVEVKAEDNCLAHAILAIAKAKNVPEYVGTVKVIRYVPWYNSCSLRQLPTCLEVGESPN